MNDYAKYVRGWKRLKGHNKNGKKKGWKSMEIMKKKEQAWKVMKEDKRDEWGWTSVK